MFLETVSEIAYGLLLGLDLQRILHYLFCANYCAHVLKEFLHIILTDLATNPFQLYFVRDIRLYKAL